MITQVEKLTTVNEIIKPTFANIFADGTLREYIDSNRKDPWENTFFEGYVYMSPKQKGTFGELFVEKYMEFLKYKVNSAPTSTAGHDRVIIKYLEEVITSKFRTEIKFALATRNKKDGVTDDKFIINHVSVGKDWDRLLFCGINPDEKDVRFVFMTKEDFKTHLKSENCLFSQQQGGKEVGNDDYMCSNVAALLECDFMRDISEW